MLMADFNETRSPLTSKNVQAWARTHFNTPFKALPKVATLKWIQVEDSFTISRAVWRSLGRSAHKQLLVIGGYAPGPEVDEPVDLVTAHVHADEPDVSFYRITKNANGDNELFPVNSTSTVAFHAPFCDLGDDTGGSKAIHRVSALILYYFLAAGHVKELVRTRADPTMFTRSFRDACSWVENDGERPNLLPSRRSSGATNNSPDTMTVRPKRASTISSIARLNSAEAACAPPIKRSATDSISVKIKRERDEDSPAPPKKHPRRTLSEQIILPKLQQETVLSPRSPAPERVNRALTDRIQHLKDENATLKDNLHDMEAQKLGLQRRLNKDARHLHALQTDSDAKHRMGCAWMLWRCGNGWRRRRRRPRPPRRNS
ncbi:hypothetical protein LEMA_P101890.1 [Plenodomus lingam JN3]|uniref:Uncharacterized protein n=1 Tax=Leptosphaeria maculans (strain JN3 / isolate v23.1.3 / race Av1-4-5-6-7-8) TaxID=985895 RepID=E5A0J8_LEPMJ|nr:hypothetical protein LEMA_P101890.1 [Plenodomus lingam JN3]CBX97058.1 hypothetical protein LEMA_P101890.1 [Plenodomus lingam JN3]